MKCELCGTRYRGDYCPSCGARNPNFSNSEEPVVLKKPEPECGNDSSLKPWEKYHERGFSFDNNSIDSLKPSEEKSPKRRSVPIGAILLSIVGAALIISLSFGIYEFIR